MREENSTIIEAGSLVAYKYPLRYYLDDGDPGSLLGIVFQVEKDFAFFVKVLWSDGLICLESLEDLIKIK